ncbi:MAG: phosphotransferase [Alphaproteobacteria bacterium]|nr:phosphotransferase [Alphaproteobacteria bacterium]
MTMPDSIISDPQAIADKFGLKHIQPLQGDASPRRYFRGQKHGKSVIAMFYPDANHESRAELKNFLKISDILARQGIKVAECYEMDKQGICALLEDLGTLSFGDCLREGSELPENMYKLAIQALIQMRKISETGTLPTYKQTGIYANRRQMIDYYMTLKKGIPPGEPYVNEFHALWEKIEKDLPPCPQGFIHGDYHLENLVYAKNEQGARQCAVIDHQDAFYGPLPYDLVNLLEDARIDVPPDIRSSMIEMYTQGMSKDEKDAFMVWYTVLAAQFHGRVIGLFIKFAAEQNRDSYLTHIPRLQNYLTESLKAPVLAPLKQWFDKVKLDFQPITPLDGEQIRAALKQN